MKRKRAACFFIVALVTILFVSSTASISPLAAKEAPEQLLESLPPTVEAFVARTPYLYDDPRAGASRGYNDPSGIAITLYLYDLGLGDIEDGITAKVLLEDKENVIDEIRNSWRNVSVVTDGIRDVDLGKGRKVPVLFTQFSFQAPDEGPGSADPLRSELYLLGMKGYICKIRITRFASTPEKKEQEIDKVVSTLLSRLATN